jgi:ribosome biogenesis SPOUT family RNA methylase Rps3
LHRSHFQQFGCLTQLSEKAVDWLRADSKEKELRLIPSEFFISEAKNDVANARCSVVEMASSNKCLRPTKVRSYLDCSAYPSLSTPSQGGRVQLSADAVQQHAKLATLRKRLQDLRYDLAAEMDCPANSIYRFHALFVCLKLIL